MINLASWNVNGIRACAKNGFAQWLQSSEFDVVGLQEVRAEESQVPAEVLQLPGWEKHWYPCTRKKGYSGVAVLSRVPPLRVCRGVGVEEFDCEGRILGVEFKNFWFFSIYFPNSGEQALRLPYKIDFCRALHQHLERLRREGKPVIVAGDYNIAHQPIDLARPEANENTAGYLPEERQWMDEFLNAGWVDTFRAQNPNQKEAYSWWSARMRARERNVGWRIDYHCLPERDRGLVVRAGILPEVKGSDHCPVTLSIQP